MGHLFEWGDKKGGVFNKAGGFVVGFKRKCCKVVALFVASGGRRKRKRRKKKRQQSLGIAGVRWGKRRGGFENFLLNLLLYFTLFCFF